MFGRTETCVCRFLLNRLVAKCPTVPDALNQAMAPPKATSDNQCALEYSRQKAVDAASV